MTGANYEHLCEKHKNLLEKYNANVPFYKKGYFRNILSVVFTLIWCWFWLDAALGYYALLYVDFSLLNPRIYILPIILFLLALRFFRPQRIILEKTLCGTIDKISYKAGYTVRTGAKGVPPAAKRQYRRTSVVNVHLGKAVITVKTPDGKTSRKKVIVHENFGDIYKEGMAVSVISGVDYPIPLEDGAIPENKVFCASCSSFEPTGYARCSMCRNDLWNR